MEFLILAGILLLGGGSVACFVAEKKEQDRVRRLKEADQIIRVPFSKADKAAIAGDAAFMAAGSSAMTMYGIYAAADKHQEALEVLKERYNHALADVDSPLEWLNYLIGKTQDGSRAIGGVGGGYVGAQGELASLDTLNAMLPSGVHAERFKNRSHASTDVRFEDSNGNRVPVDLGDGNPVNEISVKTFSDPSDAYQEIHEKPAQVTMVPRDTFQEMQESGHLQRLADEGKHVIPGDYDHSEFQGQFDSLTDSMQDAAGIGDSLGDSLLDVDVDDAVLGALLFGPKVVHGAVKKYQGQTSWKEFGVDTAVDAGRVVGAGGGFVVGTNAGMAIGTAIFPGIGTVIGAGVGAGVGVFASSSAFTYIKKKWKYGKLMNQLDLFYAYTENVFFNTTDNTMGAEILAENYMELDETNKKVEYQKYLKDKQEEIERQGRDKLIRPTPMGALARRHYANLCSHRDECISSAKVGLSQLWVKCFEVADKNQKEANRYAAMIVFTHVDRVAADERFKQLVSDLRQEIHNTPNNPYRIQSNGRPVEPRELLRHFAWKNYQEIDPMADRLHLESDNTMLLYGLMLLIVTGSIVFISWSHLGNLAQYILNLL